MWTDKRATAHVSENVNLQILAQQNLPFLKNERTNSVRFPEIAHKKQWTVADISWWPLDDYYYFLVAATSVAKQLSITKSSGMVQAGKGTAHRIPMQILNIPNNLRTTLCTEFELQEFLYNPPSPGREGAHARRGMHMQQCAAVLTHHHHHRPFGAVQHVRMVSLCLKSSTVLAVFCSAQEAGIQFTSNAITYPLETWKMRRG